MSADPVKLTVTHEQWPLTAPFRISGRSFDSTNTVTVTLRRAGHVGRGEASGVYYRRDGIEDMLRQIELARPNIEGGINRAELSGLLPAGGARNAVDCAIFR